MLMYSVTCYFSKLELIAHYEANNKMLSKQTSMRMHTHPTHAHTHPTHAHTHTHTESCHPSSSAAVCVSAESQEQQLT